MIIGQHNYYYDTTMEELVEALDWFTGLNFAVSITRDDLGTAVEWLPESTIFDTEATSVFLYGDEGGDKEEHSFADNAALRWFMLDSLAETLGYHAEKLHYIMDGGKDLVLNDLTPVDTFPADAIYEGRPA